MSETDRTASAESENETAAELNISTEMVCFIIVKAREFDVKVDPVEPDPASNPADDGQSEILEDYPDDPTQTELRDAIDDLNEDEAADLVALAWIGRGDFDRVDLEEARALAQERHRRHAGEYLIGIPTLGDLLEEGLAAVGHSCEEFEVNRL